jgi:hypothetical protein
MSTIILRGGVAVENALELALVFLAAYSSYEAYDSSGPASFDESDLRLANQGGARISTAEIAAILERRGEIERALRKIHPDASLADATSSIPWTALTRLFDAFAEIRGVGFSKMTKALHRKRPALIPILDSVVQAYLTRDDPGTRSQGLFGEARRRARQPLQTRPGSQPVGSARDPTRAGEPREPAHRGANPRPPDLVSVRRDLNVGCVRAPSTSATGRASCRSARLMRAGARRASASRREISLAGEQLRAPATAVGQSV